MPHENGKGENKEKPMKGTTTALLMVPALVNQSGRRQFREDHTGRCGAKLSRIAEDISEKLDIVPAKIRVIRTIRPFAVGRRNWLFAGHPNGAHASATRCSLVTTARACGLDPYHYLRFRLA